MKDKKELAFLIEIYARKNDKGGLYHEMIDLDVQGGLEAGFGLAPIASKKTNIFVFAPDLEKALKKAEGVLPDLKAGRYISGIRGEERKISEIISESKECKYILIIQPIQQRADNAYNLGKITNDSISGF